jgi:hypothetical protein
MAQPDLLALIETLAGVRVLCVGDAMIDHYVQGRVERISPEAPVPVLHVEREERRLGGAGNVLRNLHALGAETCFISVTGSDPAGRDLSRMVAELGTSEAHVIAERGRTTTVKTLGGSIIDSPVVLAGGDVVVGDQAKVLHRFRPDGTQVWAAEPVLDGPVLAPLVLAGGSAALLVPTAAGTLHAVAADGTVLWGGALTQGQALRAGNVHTPPGAAFGTAYFGSSDGKLYAVAVEGRLDAAAPWPKAHHDARNTSNAASPLP